MDNATHIAGSSFAPAAKRQQLQFERDNESDDEACIDDILELLSKNDVVSALDALLSETGSTRGQTTFCENKKNKRKRKARKKKSKKQNSAGSKVLSMKAVVIEIMKYLTIKNIVSDRRINHFLKDLLHFKFMCDNHNVYFEYSNKMLVDITVKHQVCDNIGNIALWYFASLNRIVGQAIFEREKTKENDSKIQFDAFVKNDINSTNPSEHQKIYLFSINSRTKAQIKEYPWLLSSLLSKFSMNETTGDCEVLPFDEMHTQLKNIKQNVKAIANSQEKHVFGDVDYLILGWLYGIKPIERLFRLWLLTNEAFRDMIQQAKPILIQDACDSNTNVWRVAKYLGPFFQRFIPYGGMCFDPYCNLYEDIRGRPSLFAEVCMKGDFSLYENYIATIKDKTTLRLKSGDAMNGIFGLMVLFMRFDLVDAYIHFEDQIDEVNETLHFVLDPNIMIQYKNQLLTDGMIPLTEKDEFQMDIFNNKLFHPKNRMLMFYKLCYSTNFAFSHVHRCYDYSSQNFMYTHVKFRELIQNLYDSFDYFVNTWHLKEYDDIANDETLQHKMHDQLRKLIQYFFGFSHLALAQSRLDAMVEDPRGNTITDVYIRQQGKQCTICPNYQFIDLMPQNTTELDILFNDIYMDNQDQFINQYINVNTISHYLQYPRFDHLYQLTKQPKNSKPLQFDAVPPENVYQLFCDVWKIGADYE